MNENTEVIPLDADTLEVQYYDDGRPGTYRCWKLSLDSARDIARWWAETGSRVGADRPVSGALLVGRVWLSFLSATQVYALECDKLGHPNITGLQLPRDAVGFLSAWLDRNLGLEAPQAESALGAIHANGHK